MTARSIFLRCLHCTVPVAGLVLLVGGCHDGPGPNQTGSVRVSVQTTGQAVDPDGYMVMIDDIVRALGTNGEIVVEGVAEGTSAVQLTGVATNCAVGGANPRSIAVTGGDTVQTAFQVSCVGLGSVQVSVVTSGDDPDPDGYTVTVGDSVRSLAVNGQVTVSGLAAGPTFVALRDVAANCAVGAANPQGITVVADSTVATAFDVTCVLSAWRAVADMRTGRLGLATAVVDGYVYAIGGYTAATAPGLKTVERYDPALDKWSARADMPTGRRWLAAAAVSGKIYAIGGQLGEGLGGLATVEEYDPASDTWATRSDMPTARKGVRAAVVSGVIYVVGGAFGTVEAYDPATDSWASKAGLPTPRGLMALEVVAGKIYAIGGGSDPATGTAVVEVYDPATDSWTSGADMPTPRSSLCGGVVGDRIYAIGGAVGGAATSIDAVAATEEYDPVGDLWVAKANMLTARWGLACATVDGKIYAIGGALGSVPHPGVQTVEMFDPTVP